MALSFDLRAGLVPRPSEPALAGDLSDAALVTRAQAGSRAAFDRLAERHYPTILCYLIRKVRAAELAGDLTQETFLDAWRDLGRLRDGDAILPWLYRIARNTLLPAWRRRAPDSMDALLDRGAAPSALRGEDPADDCVEREVVLVTLGRLSDVAQQALVLHAVHGLTCEEVGQRLGISREAAKKRIGRAKADFRKEHRLAC